MAPLTKRKRTAHCDTHKSTCPSHVEMRCAATIQLDSVLVEWGSLRRIPELPNEHIISSRKRLWINPQRKRECIARNIERGRVRHGEKTTARKVYTTTIFSRSPRGDIVERCGVVVP